MRYLFLIIILSGCYRATNNMVPGFSSNSNYSDIYSEAKCLVSENDLSIVYTRSVPYNSPTCKIFTLKDSIWEKIEIRSDAEIDSLEFVIRETILRKQCDKAEGERFFQSLLKYNLFSMEEEENILDRSYKSQGQEFVNEGADAPASNFQIIARNKVRTLRYYNVFKRRTLYPKVQDWQDISEIENLFDNQWFAHSH